ncbi:flagellar hook-associated protein FlgL [Pectobacteriaceae bacterium CE90]|nr:flagellar hook-associated protein FlgL [Pectobacteriaceae bacterium CE90]
MRLSTSMIYQQNMQGITDGLSAWQKTGNQLATNKRVINPSDDPVAASQAVMVRQAQSQNQQYTLARTFAKQNMQLESSILDSVNTAITSASSEVISGGGVKSDDDRNSVALTLQALKDQLLNLANTTDGNGNYIFGGYKTDSKPFVTDASGTVSYAGGTQPISQQVDASRSMNVSHTGNQVFSGVTGDAVKEPDGVTVQSDLFQTLDIAIAALKKPYNNASDADKALIDADLAKANRGLRNSLNNVSAVNSELGVQLKEIDSLDSLGANRDMNNKNELSALVDADIISVTSTYLMQQQSLQAAYKAFTNMQGLSLFQINK